MAIVDRAHARQPIVSRDGRYALIFNGEIYNFRELRQHLSQLGAIFTTDSDTEVLLEACIRWGPKALNHLNGMFAFILVDLVTRSFFTARDPFGIKPLYWARDQKGSYYFASEIKSLAHLRHLSPIRLFPPGHFMENGQLKQYWHIPQHTDHSIIETYAVKQIRLLFDEAVRIRVQTDLPVAVYLSGGIDSTSVLATARKYHNNVTAIIAGRKRASDRIAAIRYCRAHHVPFIVKTPPSERTLARLIPNIIKITESFEPNMIRQSAVSYHIAKTAADYGFKIVLCGEGADELFGGYPEFLNAPTMEDIEKRIRMFMGDLHRTQLQRVDRTSMHFTTEVRVPFLDQNLARYALRIPASLKIARHGNQSITKYILRKAMRDRLPAYICNRDKVVLSEGAGFKGNQRVGGLFYDIVSKRISDRECAFYQKKYRDWGLQTKEDVYYFRYFQKYGYSKAVFNKKRPTVNAINTLAQDTHSAARILSAFNTRRFKRENPSQPERLISSIQQAIDKQQPISLIAYWGKGERVHLAKPEKDALAFLHAFTQTIASIYPLGIRLQLIFTDTHALLNGYTKHDITTYYSSLRNHIAQYGWESIRLSRIQPMDYKNLIQKAPHTEIPRELLHTLIRTSRKHNKRLDDHDLGARSYYLLNQFERKAVAERFPHSIFLTYNSSAFNPLFPETLPIFYLYSLRAGTSVKPWFS